MSVVRRSLSATQTRSKPACTNSTINACVQANCQPPSVRAFCNRTTWHGVSDFYESSGWGRFFWCTAIILAFIASCYGCYAIVAQYRESPVVISYMIHPSEHGRNLPDVVVCPFNRFNISFLNNYQVPEDLLEYIQSAFSLSTPYMFQRNQPYLPDNYTVYAKALDELLIHMGNITFESFIDRASFNCSALIDYCVYPDGIVDCCETAESVVTPVGKCYRLKGAEQISSGFGFGMTIVIRVPGDKYLSPGRNNLHNIGVSVKLAEEGKGLDFDLTFVPAGVHALMPLRARKYEFINDPPRYECFSKVNQNYSSVRCFDDCFFKPGMEKCKCRHVTSPNTEYRACRPDEFFYCLIQETVKVMGDGKEYVKRCHQRCMTPCSYWAFHPTVSYAKFPSKTFYQYVDIRDSATWDRTIILDVFYEKLEYTLIKHFPSMTPDTFIANIGGQVGLWIGGSILSLAQLIVFLVHYVCSKVLLGEKKGVKPTHQGDGNGGGNDGPYYSDRSMSSRKSRHHSPDRCRSACSPCSRRARMRSPMEEDDLLQKSKMNGAVSSGSRAAKNVVLNNGDSRRSSTRPSSQTTHKGVNNSLNESIFHDDYSIDHRTSLLRTKCYDCGRLMERDEIASAKDHIPSESRDKGKCNGTTQITNAIDPPRYSDLLSAFSVSPEERVSTHRLRDDSPSGESISPPSTPFTYSSYVDRYGSENILKEARV